VGLLICNLAPGLKFRQDTLNTLKFIHSYFFLLCPNRSSPVVLQFARKMWKINRSSTNVVSNCTYQRYLFIHRLTLHAVFTHTVNRPAPKPHFAALPQPPPARLAPAVEQAIPTAGSGSGSGASRPRTSLVPVSKSHRMSSFEGRNGCQAFGVNGQRRVPGVNEKILESESNRSGNLGFAIVTEKDIDERVCCSLLGRFGPSTDALKIGAQISKAVEAEVARRLAERERERAEREQAEQTRPSEEQTTDSKTTQSRSKSPEREHSIPSGVLAPLLKRHRELDDELKSRLQELEQK